MADDGNLEVELQKLSREELDIRFLPYLSMDTKTFKIYCDEYASRCLVPPWQEMMDH